MKIITTALVLILFLFMTQSKLYSADADVEDFDINYSREYLASMRDEFIEEHGDLPIKEIKIDGIKKTSKSLIIKDAGVLDGDRLSAFDPHRFVTRLKKRNLFSEIKISYIKDNDSVIINTLLREKWTLVPIPMFYSNGDKTLYGIYIIESNFLGYGKTLFGGAAFSADDKSFILGYMDSSINDTRLAANLFFVYRDALVEDCAMDKFIFRKYKVKQKSFSTDIGWAFTDEIKWFVSGGYIACDVDQDYKDSLKQPESENFYRYGTYLSLNFLDYYEYLYYGFRSLVRFYSYAPDKENKTYRVVYYEIDYSYKLFSYHKITLFSSGSTGNRPALLEDRLGGRNGSRTLPASIIPADHYINYSIIYEYPLIKLKYGAFTTLLLWEQGIYSNDDSKNNKYYGPGAGLLFYLKRIAFPAVGLNYAMNLKTRENEISANVSTRF